MTSTRRWTRTDTLFLLQKEFHGMGLVHMAAMDVSKHPHFLKSRFTKELRETPSLFMFHKGHKTSHWSDHSIHKDKTVDHLKSFERDDFFRLLTQQMPHV